MNDDKATQFANLSITRSRILADLGAVRLALKSVNRSIEHATSEQDKVNNEYIDKLQNDALDEDDRQKLYREWGEAITEASDDLEDLTGEHERLLVQEMLLRKMATEIDNRLADLKDAIKKAGG